MEKEILLKLQSEINYLLVKDDLTHLGEVLKLLNRYIAIQELNKSDIKKLESYPFVKVQKMV